MSSEGSLENARTHEGRHTMEGIEPLEASKSSNIDSNQTIPISSATAASDNSNDINHHKTKHFHSQKQHKAVPELTPEEKAAKEAEDKRIAGLQQAFNAALKKQKDDFELQMKKMPELVFGGRLIFVKTAAEDTTVFKELVQCGVLGVDFEWRPDFQKDQQNRLSIVQVCNGYRCYIWCLYQYKGVPKGLHRLLLNPNILKVGCGMRGSDLVKLHISGLGVSPPMVITKTRHGVTTSKYSIDLPAHFIDVQDFKLGKKHNIPLPFKGLNHLTALYLRHNAPNNLNPTKALWHLIEDQTRLQEYAIADCYAVFLIWLRHYGYNDLFERLIKRDDTYIEQVLLRHNIMNQASLGSLSSLSPSADDPHFLDYTHIPHTKIPAPADSVLPIVLSIDYSSPRRIETRQQYIRLIQAFKKKNYRNDIGDDACQKHHVAARIKSLSEKIRPVSAALYSPASTSQGGTYSTQKHQTASRSSGTIAPQIPTDSHSAQPPNSSQILPDDPTSSGKANPYHEKAHHTAQKPTLDRTPLDAPSTSSEATNQNEPPKLSRRQKMKLRIQRRQEEIAANEKLSVPASSSVVTSSADDADVPLKPSIGAQTSGQGRSRKGTNLPAITRLKAHLSKPPKIGDPVYNVVLVSNVDKPDQPIYKCELTIGARVFNGSAASEQSAKTAAAKRACAAFNV